MPALQPGALLAVALGLVLALMRLYGPKPVSISALIYIEVIRGTPLLIQLFFIFYALPYAGIKLSPFVAAVLGLGLNYAAYEAENYRGGIAGVPKSGVPIAEPKRPRKSPSPRWSFSPALVERRGMSSPAPAMTCSATCLPSCSPASTSLGK